MRVSRDRAQALASRQAVSRRVWRSGRIGAQSSTIEKRAAAGVSDGQNGRLPTKHTAASRWVRRRARGARRPALAARASRAFRAMPSAWVKWTWERERERWIVCEVGTHLIENVATGERQLCRRTLGAFESRRVPNAVEQPAVLLQMLCAKATRQEMQMPALWWEAIAHEEQHVLYTPTWRSGDPPRSTTPSARESPKDERL